MAAKRLEEEEEERYVPERTNDRLTDCGAVGVTFVKWEKKHIKTVPLRSLRKLEEKEVVMVEFRNINSRNLLSMYSFVMLWENKEEYPKSLHFFSLGGFHI